LGLKVKQPDYKLSVEKVAIGLTETCNLDFGATNFQTSIPVIEMPSYLKLNGDGIIGWQAISKKRAGILQRACFVKGSRVCHQSAVRVATVLQSLEPAAPSTLTSTL
jgi:hypothetical protein